MPGLTLRFPELLGRYKFGTDTAFPGILCPELTLRFPELLGRYWDRNLLLVRHPPSVCSGSSLLFFSSSTGGAAPLTYTWDWCDSTSLDVTTNIFAPHTFNVDTTTNFAVTLTVEDANGCRDTASYTVTIEQPVADAGSGGSVCGLDFSFNAAPSLGVGSWLQLSGPGTTSYSNVNSATSSTTVSVYGTYVYQWTEINGACSDSDTISVVFYAQPAISITTQDAQCGQNNGTATATVNGGTPPYDYVWTSGDSTAIADSLTAGIYVLNVTDSIGCTKTDSTTISDVPGPTVTLDSILDVSCYGGNDGAIYLTVSGGTPPYSFSWSDGNTTEDLSGLVSGTYTVDISDSNGCIISDSATISESSAGPQTSSIIGWTQVSPLSQVQYGVSQTLGSTYNWIITGGSVITGQGSYVMEVQWGNAGMGQVAVVETDTAGCVGDTVTLAVQIGPSIGIAAYAASAEMLIFPNPFTNATTVVFDNEEQAPYELVLYDVLGNQVRVMEGITTNEVLIEKGNLTPGVYFITLQGNGKALRGKLMVE